MERPETHTFTNDNRLLGWTNIHRHSQGLISSFISRCLMCLFPNQLVLAAMSRAATPSKLAASADCTSNG
jgi:hypothetical protein